MRHQRRPGVNAATGMRRVSVHRLGIIDISQVEARSLEDALALVEAGEVGR
jgi:hypothetical protein